MFTLEKDLRKVFSALHYGRELPECALSCWQLIMEEPPPSAYPISLLDTWRFQCRLHDLISVWLSNTCDKWSLTQIEADAPRYQVQQWLKDNFQNGKVGCQAVLLTYVIVGRFDLMFQFSELEEQTGYSRRTLERRLKTGLRLFYQSLAHPNPHQLHVR